jgi:hypothetical protein
MAEKFDVAGRLAEGLPAVDNIQSLVSACHLLGYQNNELTANASQVHERYASEDGLNLRALEADRAALERAVTATQDASSRQDRQLAAVSDAWRGGGADASLDFLRRHGDASSAATASLRTAAEALAVLRDELWRSVDGKVGAVEAIDARIAAQRAEWQAAAQTVITGDGDRSAASELIDQKVKPFVDNDIGGELSTAMRSAQASVEEAYDRTTAALTGGRDVVFDVPSGFGPTWVPGRVDVDGTVTGGTAPGEVATTPAAATPRAVNAPSPVWNAPPVAAPAAAPAPATPPPAAGMPSMPSMGGLPDVGGGLSGFGQQLADMLGGLIGSGDGDGLPDTLDDPELDEDEPEDEPEPEDDPELDEDEPEDSDDPEDDAPVDPEVEEPLDGPPVVEAAPTAVPEPPPAPLPPAEPEATPTGTPCEIAATELPQVGE